MNGDLAITVAACLLCMALGAAAAWPWAQDLGRRKSDRAHLAARLALEMKVEAVESLGSQVDSAGGYRFVRWTDLQDALATETEDIQ